MTLDDDALRVARQTRDQLLELEHETDRARADYQHSIRRLHAAGGSMREIADHLGLSHQRVHQIVDAGHGTGSARGPGEALLDRIRGRARKGIRESFARFTKQARTVVVLAQDEARELDHTYIGTEHILLGLLREEEGLAGRALNSLDVSLDDSRAAVVRILGEGKQSTTRRRALTAAGPPFTPRAKRVLEHALREALGLKHNYIGTEHILLGLLREGEGVAMEILRGFGADDQTIRRELTGMLEQ